MTKSEILKLIRANCLDCAHTANEVTLCPMTHCPLWSLRFGKDPRPNKRLSPEHLAALKAGREAKANADTVNPVI